MVPQFKKVIVEKLTLKRPEKKSQSLCAELSLQIPQPIAGTGARNSLVPTSNPRLRISELRLHKHMYTHVLKLRPPSVEEEQEPSIGVGRSAVQIEPHLETSPSLAGSKCSG